MKVSFTHLCIAFLLLLTATNSFAQTQFWADDFESEASSNGTRTPSYIETAPVSNRYYRAGTTSDFIVTPMYTNVQGTRFWAAEDVDNVTGGDPSQDVSWSVSIAGKMGIAFEGYFATGLTTVWDHGTATSPGLQDYMVVQYNIDGGEWTDLISFQPNSFNMSNGALAVDANGDGLGDGTALTNAFAKFSASIPGTGTILNLRCASSTNALAEELAFDDFRLFETPVCTAPTIIAQPATNSDVCNAGTKTISITATGATTYQWQVDASGTGSGPWTDLTSTGFYSGVNTNTLSIAGANATIQSYDYRCKAINGTASCVTTSSSSNLRVSIINLNTNAQSNVSCFGGSNGTAVVIPSGGINGTAPGAYAYSWSPSGGTSNVATGLGQGTYTVTATDAMIPGCSVQRSFNITQPSTSVSATSVTTNVTCNTGSNGAINLTPAGGTPGYFVSWGGGVFTEDRVGLPAGTYSVTVEDANGCQASYSIPVTQPPAISGSMVVTNLACNGGTNGSIDLTPAGGTAPYTYNWGGGITTQDRTGLAAGSYSVTITDANSCTKTVSATLTQPSALSGATVVTNVSCNGGTNGSIDLTPTGGTPPYTYSWGGGITTQDRTGLAAGGYSVTITDANSCTATVSVTVTQPAAISGTTVVTNIACFGGSTGAINLTPTGGTGPYTFSWLGGGTTEDRTGLPAGTYQVTITDANGCTGTVTATVTQPAAPVSGTTVVTNIACFGGSTGAINLTPTGGVGPYTFNWLGGGTTEDRTGLSAGTYQVTITDANGCTGTVTATVTQPSAAVSGTTVVTNVACFGSSTGAINLTPTGGTGPYTYSWGGGSTTEDRILLSAGTYSVTITDANGCTGTVSATVTQPSAAVSGTTVVTNVACYGSSTGAINLTPTGGTGPYTYSWGGGITTEDRVLLSAGTYSVTITDANGCTGTVSATVTQPSAAVSGTTVVTNVSCNGGSNGSINLTPTGGVGPYTFSWLGGGTTEDRTGLSAGTYQVTITDANGCTATVSATVTQPVAFSVITSQTNVTCNGGTNGTATVNVSGGTAPYIYSWSPSGGTAATATGLTVGTYTVTITDENTCQTTRHFDITQPVALTATANPTSQTICSGDQTNIALSSSPSGANFSWTVSTISGNVSGASASDGSSIQQTLTGNGVVKYIITPDNGICTGAPVSVSITVNPLTTIDLHPTDKSVYDEESASFSIEASNASSYRWQVDQGSGFVNISDDSHYSGATTATLTVSDITGSMNGYSYHCVAFGNCAPVESNSALLTVKVRTPQTIAFAATDEKVYGTPDFTPAANSSAGLGLTFTSSDESIAAIVDGKVQIKKIGEVTITASQDGNDDYKPATSVQQTLTINKRPVTVSLLATPLITKVYDGNTEATPATENYSLVNAVEGDDITIQGTAAYANSNAGTDKDITVEDFVLSGSDKDNYSLGTTSAVVKGDISPKSLAVSILPTPAISKTYDGTNKATLQQEHYSITGVLLDDEVNIGESEAVYADKNVGLAKVITVNDFVLAGADKDNYALSTASATTSGDIVAKEITASFAQTPVISKTYDGNAAANIPAEKYQLSDVESGDDVSVTATAVYDDRNAGEGKTVTANLFELQGEDKGNYLLTTSTATTTGDIQKAAVNVTLQSSPAITKVYDGTTDASLQASNYTVTGIIGSDVVLLNNPAVGSYDTKHGGTGKKVTVTGLELSGADLANYQLLSTSASGNIGEITKKEITLSAQAQTKQYGAVDPVLGYTADGILEGDELAGALSREEGKNVGTYTITIGTLSGGDDYDIVEFVPETLTITPAPLTIKADDKEKKQGAANPVFTFTYEGLVEGDQPSDMETPATAATNAGNGSPMGFYDIEASGASSGNYTITFEKGRLTVTPASGEKYSLKAWSSSREMLQVRIYSDVPQKAAIVLYGETGRQLILEQKQLSAGVNNYSIYVGKIASSTYIVGVTGEKFKKAEKVQVK